MDQKFMKEKPILPLVISMALPMVISMAINSLYNIVDSFFVAQISENAMTALSLVYPLQNLMTAIAVGFGIGINARIAYCLGAGEKKTCKPGCYNRNVVKLYSWSYCDGGMYDTGTTFFSSLYKR